MKKNLAMKLLESHLLEGSLRLGEEIGLKVDQTLTHDASGMLITLQLEAIGISRTQVELSAVYMDHNLLETDFKNADDHIFLQSACDKYGMWYSRAGNGVSHPVHMECFGIPGKMLLGSDSHTPAAGSLGMLAIGAGGLDVALAISGYPFFCKMPKIRGIHVVGKLPPWVSAKDVILELLRRHDVEGGLGWIFEYFGPGLASLSAMDRHVICNMGTEMGALTSVFPSDEEVKKFLKKQNRLQDWQPLAADEGAIYDEVEELDLSSIEPLIACPSSPGNVVPVREVAGREVYQTMIGSSGNPGFRDFAIAAEIVSGRQIHERVSFDVNPTSRQILENLTKEEYLLKLIHAGARIHQAGCNGCIGMGQAPATGRISLRTVPRNFPGRSGTKEDSVYLCSPETAAASALKGVITDPRDLGIPYPVVQEPETLILNREMLVKPHENRKKVKLIKGPNVSPLPVLECLEDTLKGPILIKLGNDISTDEICPAGAQALPLRANVPATSQFIFEPIDPTYVARAHANQKQGHFIVAGLNYGQGSSRETAAICSRYLGVRMILAKSFSRIHWKNLVNFGILPLVFVDETDYEKIDQGDFLEINDLIESVQKKDVIEIRNQTKQCSILGKHALSKRQIKELLAGGIINYIKKNGTMKDKR